MEQPLATPHMSLAPSPSFLDTDSNVSSAPPSPLSVEFIEAAEALDSLAQQLGQSKYEDDGQEVKCCCGKASGSGGPPSCQMIRAKEKVEDRLKLSGEVGNALLARYEALEKKCLRQVEKYEQLLQIKRAALADSVKRVHNLEKANATHMQRYAEMTKKNEALDKRYTQALHTQTLTQQSLTHVRGELADLRNRHKRQSVALASGIGAEDRLAEVERLYEETKVTAEFDGRRLKDELRRRTRLEARIEELETQLTLRTREVDEVKEARSKDVQDLLSNAKQRLDELHTELSETFRSDDPSELPQYQRILNDLVASNTLLKHDTTELARQLLDAQEENRTLRDENDELRSAVGVARRASPELHTGPGHLAGEVSHARTGSSPVLPNLERSAWVRRSVQVPASSRILLQHGRNISVASSFMTSSSTAADISGLGMGSTGAFDGSSVRDDKATSSLSPAQDDGRQSPSFVLRSSPSGGIGYVVNGVPKGKAVGANRTVSMDRKRLSLRSFSPKTSDIIAEWGPIEGDGVVTTARPADTSITTSTSSREPSSPGNEYFKAAEMARIRRSMLGRTDNNSPRDSVHISPNISQTLVDQSITADLPSPMSEGSIAKTAADKRVHRRTLLLLTRSQGTQTDPPIEPFSRSAVGASAAARTTSMTASVVSSPGRHEKESDTSSLQDSRATSGVMTLLIEYLTKTLGKIQGTDITTLNRRLRKQHLPGDVQHVSRTSLQAVQQEILDLRQAFRGVLDLSNVTRKEFTSLLKLFREVFILLTELQALVNDVTIDPHLAKKLHREANALEGEEVKDAKQPSGLGWIAAPITKLFVTAPDASEVVEPVRHVLDNRRLGPGPRPTGAGTMKAPKLQASTSSTTTHVSVEFGGAGIVRRSTPAQGPGSSMPPPATVPQPRVTGDLPASPDPSGGIVFAVDRDGRVPHLEPSTIRGGTLRPTKSKANRNELLGIFAGATRPISPTPWVVLPQGSSDNVRPLRTSTSRQFRDKSARNPDMAPGKRLPAAVDAVIDSRSNQIESEDGNGEAPPLLERTLRRRGLSDSSIRSTFVSSNMDLQAELDEASMPTQPQAQGIIPNRGGPGYAQEKRGYFGGWTSRLYSFKATVGELDASQRTGPASQTTAPSPSESLQTTSTVPSVATLVDSNSAFKCSPPRPIKGRPSTSTASAATSVDAPANQNKHNGLLGYLAETLVASSDVDGDGTDEYQDARHRAVSGKIGIPPGTMRRVSGWN